MGDCTGSVQDIGDGYCDSENNNPECMFDGGDCCACTCEDGSHFGCGISGFDCRDPEATHPVHDCQEVPIVTIPCSSAVQGEWVVNDSVSASALADAVRCSDGTFNVEWRGEVALFKTIYVSNGTLLRVTGVDSDAAVNGEDRTRLFAVKGASLELSNMTMKHGMGVFGGCVAATESSLLFRQTSFTGGTAGEYGGALYVGGGSTIVWRGETVFTGNIAGEYGGAIYVGGGSTIVWRGETVFTGNIAGTSGGAIYVESHTSATFKAASFVNNTAGYDGGALMIREFSTAFWEGKSYFDGNSAGFTGGGLVLIFNSASFWEAEGSSVEKTAESTDDTLYLAESSMSSWEAKASFVNNIAGGGGGALVVVFGSIASWDVEASFVNNTAGGGGGDVGYGGAVYVQDDSAVFWEKEALFASNVAGLTGGAVLVWNSIASWEARASFIGNFAGETGGAVHVREYSTASWEAESSFVKNTVGLHGGGVFVKEHSMTFWGGESFFTENTARGDGGAVNIEYTSKAVWQAESSFVENSVGGFGGALLIVFDSTASWEASASFVNNTCGTIDDNSFRFGGGAASVFWNSTASWTADATFVDNFSHYIGGALRVNFYSSARWEGNSTFINNGATIRGGALFVHNFSTASWKGEVSFVDNFAEYGGGLDVREGSSTLCESEAFFLNNFASKNGGAMYIFSEGEVALNDRSMFKSNTAFGDGGAVYVYSPYEASDHASLVLNGPATFFRNGCHGNGGAMALTAAVYVKFGADDIMFIDNTAGVSGGAASIRGVPDGPQIVGVRFRSNIAPLGGAVYLTGSGTAIAEGKDGNPLPKPTTFKRCQFISNTGRAAGGAVGSASGLETFENSRFEGNDAREGGALRLGGTASLVNCTFVENVSEEDGGSAVSNSGAITSFVGGLFIDNVFDCEEPDFLDFKTGSAQDAFSTVCKGCDNSCQNCYTSPKIPQCSEAMEHTRSLGGNTTLSMLLIDRGYWRTTSSSREILVCYNNEACRGGLTGAMDYCGRGYEGPYCSVCSDGFFSSIGYTCTKCSENTVGIVSVLTAAVLVLLGVVCCFSFKVLNGITQGARRRTLAHWNRRLLSFKIVIITWQILAQLASVANITYPGVYQQFLDGIDIVNLDLGWILQTGCVVTVNFHGRLIMSTIGPILGLIVIGAAYVVARRRCWRSGSPMSRVLLAEVDQRYLSIMLFLTFLVYSSVSSILFQAFACDRVDDGNIYLRADYRIKCDSSMHFTVQVYAGFMIGVYTVGIPIIYAALLFRHREVLTDVDLREGDGIAISISSLWRIYKPRYFYYELVECLRRVVLAGVVVFIYPNTVAQIAVALMIAAIFMVLYEGLSPYSTLWDAWASRLGHAIVFCSIYVALLLKVNISNERVAGQKMFEAVLIGAHVVMVVIALAEVVVVSCSWFRRMS